MIMKTRNEISSGRNPYIWAGLFLLMGGTVLVLTAIFVLGFLVWLIALGISLLIISFIILALSKAAPDVPPSGESTHHGNRV